MSAVAPNPIDDRDLVKESDVGRIPIDWDAKPLSALASIKSGESITSTSIDEHSPFPCYGGNGLRGYTVRYTHEGNHALIGRQGALCGNVLGVSGRFFASEHAIVATARSGIDIRWLTFVLHRMKLNRYSESSAQPGLSVSKLQNLPVAVPQSQDEQEAIAAALSDADALIEELENLIMKKRTIKQGAMQELFSGRRRLAGFGSKWETRKLGSIGQFLKGSGVNKNQAQSGDLPCIRYGEIYTDHNDILRSFRSFISREVAATATRLKPGDILFAGSGETKQEIGKCVAFASSIEAYAGGDIVILRSSDHDPVFLGYALNFPDVQSQKAAKGQGDAVVHISATALASLDVSLPEPNEQHAIAEVLSHMDDELQALTSRLAKAGQIKQGMMQELLSGRVRLV